ncbi:MAG: hypothetical protein IKD66_07975, partial [Solobacterium sp.]|nr:hypothetical protein [Solobacterium sp.]
ISRAELPELEDYKKREKTHALSNKCHIILAVEALPSPLCSKTSIVFLNTHILVLAAQNK